RDLHSARQSGLLTGGDLNADDLLRRLGQFAPVNDDRAARELEWFALWQMADDVAREGLPGLRPLFESRSERGDSLLVGLLVCFLRRELEVEGNVPPDPGTAPLP